MKKIVLLFFCSLICCYVFSGCYKGFDYDQSAKVAEEYMKSKYNVSIKNITHDDMRCSGQTYDLISFELDSDDNMSEGTIYKLQVYRDRETKQNYYVKSDNYLEKRTADILDNWMNGIINELSVTEYTMYNIYTNQINEDEGFFEPNYKIPESNDITDLFLNYNISFDYNIYLPESSYFEKFEEVLKDNCSEFTNNSKFTIHLRVYSNRDYSIIKDFSVDQLLSSTMWAYKPIMENFIVY